jgi:predicted nucleic acid-binding protein
MLLDTDVVVDILRGYPPGVSWLQELGEETVVLLPGFVVMEAIDGCRNLAEQKRVEDFVERFRVLWPEPETCQRAFGVYLREHLRSQLGILDCLIGQMAVDLELPLCTFNRKHYSVVPGLRIEEPYPKSAP